MTEWLYGRHAVEEVLRAARRNVFRVLLSEAGRGSRGAPDDPLVRIETEARRLRVSLERVPPARLDAITKVGQHHQGVAAEVSGYPYSTLAEVVALCRDAGPSALVLLLDSIQDPQNFGTLLRSAEAVGVTAVVMLERRQVEVTAAVVNASAGAVEHLTVCQTNNLPRAIEALQEAGLWVYALQAEPGAVPYTTSDLKGPLGLVVGSEGSGVGRLVRERCDGALLIPMWGKMESLNAAVAGSIVLYEALRQRTSD
ncbi:MAG: rRNA (guanosine2251-2-O)-methyltransferase [Chloroflexia bacterium]|jgi:23S rRNA (guanosine2251-2'-O)-methyltransferase|nr:rRNA (guanosine2251-2-O)-methyltransferase [Chloroflexia bacterium]